MSGQRVPWILWRIRKENPKTQGWFGGGTKFSQGEGASLRVPGLLLISVLMFSFQPPQAPISQSLSPQENACCLVLTTSPFAHHKLNWEAFQAVALMRHSMHVCGGLYQPLPASLPHPWWVCFLSWRRLAERSRCAFVVCIKSSSVSLTLCLF